MNKQHFQLIDGTFTAAEAARVLLALVKSKMDYHRMERFSNEERFGRDHSHSERRLRELEQLTTTLKEALASAADARQNLRIDGRIEISLVPNAREANEPDDADSSMACGAVAGAGHSSDRPGQT